MVGNKKANLKKHKTIATGLFLLMTSTYFLMVYLNLNYNEKWIGYMKAFSEAAMVGALADWFAVTALFSYPLGLKIPHTNLIENSKNDIGDNLGQFVTSNFLTPSTIRPYIENFDPIKYVSEWINKTSNQILLQKELIKFINKILNDLDDKTIINFMSFKGYEISQNLNLPILISSGLEYILDKEKHNDFLEYIFPKVKKYIQESDEIIKEKINEKHPIVSFFAGKKISEGVVDGVISFLDEIETDKNHPIRINIENNIRKTIDEIKNSAEWKSKLNSLRDEIITQEKLNSYTSDLWMSIKQNLSDSFTNPNSSLQIYIHSNILKLNYNLNNDKKLINKINGWIRYFLYRIVLKNVNEIEGIISGTIDKWEGKDLSEKLELEVGKDLQFIRINGTLVGGLVGLIIYTITNLLFH